MAQPNRTDPRVEDGFRPMPSGRPIDPTSLTQRRDVEDDEIVLNTTEARQANSKTTNMWVLFWSLLAAVVLGFIMVSIFWKATPPGMDGKVGRDATSIQKPIEPIEQAKPVAPANTPPAEPPSTKTPATPPAPNTAP